jgi:acyl carrier protein
LRGIVHAAGILDDNVLTQTSWSRFEKVMAPKVRGAWLLHQLTASRRLDFFVLFAAGAAIVGAPGQSNYAAANAFLDALAHYRASNGAAALSVDWGPWADVGMATTMDDKGREHLARRGFRALSVDQNLEILRRLLGSDKTQVIAASADWSRLATQDSAEHRPALLQELIDAKHSVSVASTATESASQDLSAQLKSLPVSQRWMRIVAVVERHAAAALGLNAGRMVDPKRPLHDLGLDSLQSVELRNVLAATLGCRLSATLLFDYPTVEAVARHLANDVLKIEISREEAGSRANQAEEALMELSDDDAEALLLSELERARS